MTEIADLRKYLLIDQNNLDEELIRQPSLYFKVAEEAVVAAANRDMFKEDLAEADARIDTTIRKLNEGQKLTEGAIKNQVQLHDEHHEAMGLYLDAKEKADLWSALKEAFHSRGYMLRELCHLRMSEYNSSSSVSSREEVYNNGRLSVRQAIDEALKRPTKK